MPLDLTLVVDVCGRCVMLDLQKVGDAEDAWPLLRLTLVDGDTVTLAGDEAVRVRGLLEQRKGVG